MNLVIVESPAKAKTIEKYLGKDFKVVASLGHVRDLPSKTGSVLPEEDFAIRYVLNSKAEKHMTEILNLAKKAEIVYLATDPDREGESISWHVVEVIKERIPNISAEFKRIAFNEITKKAVLEAVSTPRALDIDLVNAQQARRALDYLVGFTLSPLLWRKLPGCKSAGRVQSVALRLICERENEIEKFNSQEYWDITFDFLNKTNENFQARLTHIDNKKLEKFDIHNQETALEILNKLNQEEFHIIEIERKQQKRQPPPPFITSSLQQEAARKLGFSAKKTMQIAQKLYEGIAIDSGTVGLITYMRTDGVNMSNEAVDQIRKLINQSFGKEYLPESARIYKSKIKNAQEAHEAIRPTDIDLTPEKLQQKLDKDQYNLYDLIWKRTIACQMANVLVDAVAVDIISKNQKFIARANGLTIIFDGFYRVYHEGMDDAVDDEKTLPRLEKGENLQKQKIEPMQHFTQPPPRYTEASLVKKLEELGIGRPSTYASILSVLQDRDYVQLIKKRFVPEMRGRLLTAFLVKFFIKYVEYDFTAGLETELDEIASGKLFWKESLSSFWHGFDENIRHVADYKIAEIVSYVEEALSDSIFGTNVEGNAKKCTSCVDGVLSLKLGKYGAFVACSNYPECNFKKSLVAETANNNSLASENSTEPSSDKVIGIDPSTSLNIYQKRGPYGLYLQLGDQDIATTQAKKKATKPKRATIPAFISAQELDLNLAIKLLSLPYSIGNYTDGSEIKLGIGKFGPYLLCNGVFYSISKKINPFELKIEEAREIINRKLENNANNDKDATKQTKKAKKKA